MFKIFDVRIYMTRNEILLNVFNNHSSKLKLDQAFSTLVDAELATMQLERVKGKRPVERWFPAKPSRVPNLA
jgi:hypothetical protein